jgi:hypothetical protein
MTEPHVDRVLRVLRHLALEAGALSLQPKGMGVVGAHGADCCALVAARQNTAPLSAASFHRPTPEVGAECVSSARSDLSGGRGVTRVPTGMAMRACQRRQPAAHADRRARANTCRCGRGRGLRTSPCRADGWRVRALRHGAGAGRRGTALPTSRPTLWGCRESTVFRR